MNTNKTEHSEPTNWVTAALVTTVLGSVTWLLGQLLGFLFELLSLGLTQWMPYIMALSILVVSISIIAEAQPAAEGLKRKHELVLLLSPLFVLPIDPMILLSALMILILGVITWGFATDRIRVATTSIILLAFVAFILIGVSTDEPSGESQSSNPTASEVPADNTATEEPDSASEEPDSDSEELDPGAVTSALVGEAKDECETYAEIHERPDEVISTSLDLEAYNVGIKHKFILIGSFKGSIRGLYIEGDYACTVAFTGERDPDAEREWEVTNLEISYSYE